ncbi:hypothetical protein [Kitasatospora sp. NPDC007106]
MMNMAFSKMNKRACPASDDLDRFPLDLDGGGDAVEVAARAYGDAVLAE